MVLGPSLACDRTIPHWCRTKSSLQARWIHILRILTTKSDFTFAIAARNSAVPLTADEAAKGRAIKSALIMSFRRRRWLHSEFAGPSEVILGEGG